MKPGFFGHIFLTVLSIAYPALWYYGREAGWFVWLAAAMCGLWLLRALTAKLPQQRYAALFITLFLPQYWCSGGETRCIGIPSSSI